MATENRAAKDGPRYDVAISFLARDEPIGAALRDRLSEGLSVFFYPRNQEELAGTDGLETMRTPFFDDSRVVVVLYREPWGKTPWTRVEETAIKDGCLEHGWDRLFFVTLDGASELPIWLPRTHVRFNYEIFGLEQAVGAIKARVLECGGIIEPMTALKRAAIYKEDARYQEQRKVISSYEGMAIVRDKVIELITEINRLCDEIRADGNTSIVVGSNTGRCVIRNNSISLVVGWRQPYSNSTDGCSLTVAEFNAPIPLPDSREMSFSEPTTLSETTFLPELSRAREFGWVAEHRRSAEFLSSATLADRCVIQFLDLATRADRGEVEPPSWRVGSGHF
jgi:predicted transcriptional regulator